MKSNLPSITPPIHFLIPPAWQDYELIDSGNGCKLERYGPYILNRPEPEAIWKPSLPADVWTRADAIYISRKGEETGQWQFRKEIPKKWHIAFKELKIILQFSNSRHIGVFPEQAPEWDWIQKQIITSKIRPVKVLNLFGYSGMATLAAASVGAEVTHIDASPKAIQWARENQELSGLSNRSIRWIVDDVLKFVHREIRRGNRYEGIILDPPKFGRGPKGEVWEFYKMLPVLLDACAAILSPKPLFVVITAYAIKASSLTLLEVVEERMHGFSGCTTVGELLLQEKHAGRYLSKAIYALWSNQMNSHEK